MSSSSAKVLLLHGLLSGPAAGQLLQRHLGGQVKLIALDIPKYGRSGSRARHTAPDALVAGILPTVVRERPTHPVGHSLGAIIALGLAARLGVR